MYTHVLLAADLTDENDDTLIKARQLADLFGAKLSIMHAVEPVITYGYVGLTDIETQFVQEAKATLKKIGEDIGVAPENQWISVGPAKREIIAVAEEIKADLIVIGSHTEYSFADLLGSTTNSVLHHSPCDVITIRRHQ